MSGVDQPNYWCSLKRRRLISASLSTTIYYGFSCRPQTAIFYLTVCFILGLSGTIFPFMRWFNERKNKVCRIASSTSASSLSIVMQKWRTTFFLSLVFTLIIPMAHLTIIHSLSDMYHFISASYLHLYTDGQIRII